MKSVALLPTHGDPFMLKHFVNNYDRVWRGEVDDLYVLVSGQPDPDVAAYCRHTVEAVGGFFVGCLAPTLDHGVALRTLAESAGIRPHDGRCADIFMLIESDARVLRPGAVAGRVARIASAQDAVIGSPRVSMDGRLDAALRERWGHYPDATVDGCQGYGLWPCFVFVRADVLLHETDRNYGARGWLAGETIEGPGIVCPENGWCADTFGSAALQLRGRYPISAEVQYKGPDGWKEWLDAGHQIPWFHTGSLSSWGGSGGLLVDGDSELMDGRRMESEQELLEWGHRVCWWERFLRHAGDGLSRHRANYQRNLDRLRSVVGVEERHVQHWEQIVDRMITWDES